MNISTSYKLISNQSISITNNGAIPPKRKTPPQVHIRTNPTQININSLSNLYLSCNHSPHRFPSDIVSLDIDEGKLGVAVAHSAVVVSVFAKIGRGEDGDLVGFGRAVSDLALTASIFDVMVVPTLRRLGIGRMIVQRILRMLTIKGIYDISALCSDEERLFFAACGFGDDLLGSTTMTYGETASDEYDNDRIIARAGRKLLLSPPLRLPFSS